MLQHLADTAADAEGRDRRPVPVIEDRALGDQLTVLVADALQAGVAPADVHARLVALRRAP